MDESSQRKAMLVFTILYMIFFAFVAIIHRNYEFLYYTAIMSILILLIIAYHKPLRLTTPIMLGLTIVGALHIFGGNIHIGDVRLYDYWLIGHWFRYDNLVHFIGSGIATLIVYNLLEPHLDMKLKRNKFLLALLLTLLACGIGTINEILELVAVIHFNAAAQVGDYFNNAFDLVWNFIGASAASLYIVLKR